MSTRVPMILSGMHTLQCELTCLSYLHAFYEILLQRLEQRSQHKSQPIQLLTYDLTHQIELFILYS